ncbi:hypothetical protein RND81_07G030100 [Saponaria officinalis]|uniref:Cycloidea-like protein n=1 Tax=Saponaria officinalis TaxID=3572 RepID=A0AAW1JMH7_SAPOF
MNSNQNTYEFSHEDNNLFNPFCSQLLDHDEFQFSNTLPYYTPPPPPPPPQPQPPTMEENPLEKRKRKAVGKKDRHSKINTAHGPRDRRMRLSVQIARKFFDLQDMLGFDKASKTIEWLFNKSKAAIKDLSNQSGGSRSKESRARAREWARKRTKEKLMMKNKKGLLEEIIMEKNPNIIRVNNDEQQQGQMMNIPIEDKMASIGIIERFQHDYDEQEIMWYNDCSFVVVPENWATQK